jgi:hypothetical protein
MLRGLGVLTVAAIMGATTSTVLAQCSCAAPQTVYAPVDAGYTTYYAPASNVAYYAPTTTAYYAPATTAYYAPTTTAYYAPTTTYASYYAPVATPYTTYYAPATTYVAGYGVVGSSVYGTPKVYVPGEPVRNLIRRNTP